jgi:uncharacterized protein YgbK (DUF1537 family)
LIKTVDSTLRGHVGAEVAAAIHAARRRLTVIAPAFPDAGRTTRAGCQYIHGVALEQSQYARDGRDAASSGDLLALLGDAGLTGVQATPLARRLPFRGITVSDAEHGRDLRRLVARVADRAAVLWVGSPGLARALADSMPAGTSPSSAPHIRRWLIVAGTENRVTSAQVDRLLALAGDRARLVDDTVAAHVGDAEVLVLRAPSRRKDAGTASQVAELLAARAAALIAREEIDGCVASGGETAAALTRALGHERIDVLGEPEPGIGLGLVKGPRPVVLATKAGGFGDAGTLVRLVLGAPGNRRANAS